MFHEAEKSRELSSQFKMRTLNHPQTRMKSIPLFRADDDSSSECIYRFSLNLMRKIEKLSFWCHKFSQVVRRNVGCGEIFQGRIEGRIIICKVSDFCTVIYFLNDYYLYFYFGYRMWYLS